MKLFDPDAICPKCGSVNLMSTHCTYGWMKFGKGPSHKDVKSGQEHIDRHCKRCHYEWVEACLDTDTQEVKT